MLLIQFRFLCIQSEAALSWKNQRGEDDDDDDNDDDEDDEDNDGNDFNDEEEEGKWWYISWNKIMIKIWANKNYKIQLSAPRTFTIHPKQTHQK